MSFALQSERNQMHAKILIPCPRICVTAFLYTCLTAEKYPPRTEDTDMGINVIDRTFSGITVRSSRKIPTPIFEENKKIVMGVEEYRKNEQETVELSTVDWLNK